jgi:hypothetical protein
MSTTAVHPAHVFTEEAGRAFLKEVTATAKKLTAGRDKPPSPRPLKPLPEITDPYEAREARLRLESMGDATKALAAAHETQFDLCERIRGCEEILATNPTEQQKRDILGYEIKATPSLPGIPDSKVHVEGSLERLRAELARVESELPRFEQKAARYEQLKQQLAPWPTWKIDRIRNTDVERNNIAKGKPVQRRGNAPRSVEFVPTR